MPDRPSFIKHVSELPDNGGSVWAGSDEVLSIRTPLSRPLGLQRIGVHHEVLEPGHRSIAAHLRDRGLGGHALMIEMCHAFVVSL